MKATLIQHFTEAGERAARNHNTLQSAIHEDKPRLEKLSAGAMKWERMVLSDAYAAAYQAAIKQCRHPIEERAFAMLGHTHCQLCNAMIPPN